MKYYGRVYTSPFIILGYSDRLINLSSYTSAIFFILLNYKLKFFHIPIVLLFSFVLNNFISYRSKFNVTIRNYKKKYSDYGIRVNNLLRYSFDSNLR